MSIVRLDRARPSDRGLLLQWGHRLQRISMRLLAFARSGRFGAGRKFVEIWAFAAANVDFVPLVIEVSTLVHKL